MVVHILDRYYLAISFLYSLGYQAIGFSIAWTFQFDKVTDFTGGTNFLTLALLTLLAGQTFFARNIVASVLVMVWAVRMAGFLLLRVLTRGSDARFDEFRGRFFGFLGFWIFQLLWVWIVSLPLTILNSPAVSDLSAGGSNPKFGTSRDIAGIVIWAFGWVIETYADAAKFRFKASNPPRDQWMRKGIWHWSRHPPYFGEIMCWWGIWILCISPATNGSLSPPAKKALYASVLSPLFTFFILVFFSGTPTAEKPQAKRYFLLSHGPDASPEYAGAWKSYKEYLNSTSVLIPIPPALYRPLPKLIKRWVLLDVPMFEFDEATDGKEAIEEAKKKVKTSSNHEPSSSFV